MLTVEGVFDGQKVEILENVPFKKKKKVLITFLNDMAFEADSEEAEIDPITLLRGRSKHSHLTEKLLESRKEECHLSPQRSRI